jgi:tRNA (guanine37-N1)-methyltransferase
MVEYYSEITTVLRVATIALLPEMFDALNYGVVGRAQKRQLLKLQNYNPRDYTTDKHRTVDDRPYGGGPGMLMMLPPIVAAIAAAKRELGDESPVIYLSPQGKPFTQSLARQYARYPSIILLTGRYEGIDERIKYYIDEECSIGDYVLSGGELGAMVMIDAMTRLLPGVLGKDESAICESFNEGRLEGPHYTRPESFGPYSVPPILLEGHHKKIERFRRQQALGRTWLQRPDLLSADPLTREEQELLAEFIRMQN